MGNLLISVLVTALLAIVFHAWLRRAGDRQTSAVDAWATTAGFTRGEEAGPAGTCSLHGEHEGYEIVLDWREVDEDAVTICRVTLATDQPTSELRRHVFTHRHDGIDRLPPAAFRALSDSMIDILTVSGRHLTATTDWLDSTRLPRFLDQLTTICKTIDGAHDTASH